MVCDSIRAVLRQRHRLPLPSRAVSSTSRNAASLKCSADSNFLKIRIIMNGAFPLPLPAEKVLAQATDPSTDKTHGVQTSRACFLEDTPGQKARGFLLRESSKSLQIGRG